MACGQAGKSKVDSGAGAGRVGNRALLSGKMLTRRLSGRVGNGRC